MSISFKCRLSQVFIALFACRFLFVERTSERAGKASNDKWKFL